MTRQLITLALLINFCLTSCEQAKTENKTQNTTTNKVQVDSTAIAVIELDSSTNNTFKIFKSVTPTILTAHDLMKIETILADFTKDYNFGQEKQYNEEKAQHPDSKTDINRYTINIRRYKRQYFATTNEKGEKEVWVNCFCNAWDKNWKKEPIIVHDGGNCYFNLKINFATGKYYDLIVNGEA